MLLCTDAAAEGLNFQFCGALVNYDLPWNPMKVEQRIGLLGQASDPESRENLAARIESEAREASKSGFDLDAAIDEDFSEPERAPSPLSLDDLDLVIHAPGALPPSIEIRPAHDAESFFLETPI